MALLEHHGSGRAWRPVCAVATVWAILAAGYVWLDAEGWIVAGLGAFTLPALWDILAGRRSALSLTTTEIHWTSGRHSQTVALDDLAHVRLDRHWDGSVRVRLVGRDGQTHLVPPDATPPHRDLETALHRAGVAVQRQPFSIF